MRTRSSFTEKDKGQHNPFKGNGNVLRSSTVTINKFIILFTSEQNNCNRVVIINKFSLILLEPVRHFLEKKYLGVYRHLTLHYWKEIPNTLLFILHTFSVNI